MKRLLFFVLLAITGCHPSYNSQESPLAAIQIQDRNGLTETISSPDRLSAYESVDFLISQPYKKVLRVYRKDGRNQSKITTYHPNGSIWQYLEAEEMRAHGAYREWYSNGQMKLDSNVIGGVADVSAGSQQDWLFDGVSRVWNEKGSLIAEIPYENGQLEGISKYYYPDGTIQKKLPFVQNLLSGEGVEFYPSGAIKSKIHYQKDLKEGSNIGYFPSGQIAYQEDCSEGLIRNGAYYDPKGALFSEVENGGGFQANFDGETLTSLVEYRLGRPEGRVQAYNPKGEMQSVYHLKGGLKQGEEIHYFLPSETNGKATVSKLSINWFENSIHGTVKTWYENSQLQSQREYCRNVKLGPSLGWYRDGSLMLVEEYDEDRLVKGQYYKKNQRDPISAISNGSGIATLYDGDGIFLRKITYLKGKPADPED